MGLVESMEAQGSWCGETHIQKAVYFLETAMHVDLGFEFILYKHGPFSWDLRSELTEVRADSMLQLVSQYPFGPQFVFTEAGKATLDANRELINPLGAQIAAVTGFLQGAGVSELERLATALYVTAEGVGDGSVMQRASEIHRLKPHITVDIATDAITRVDGFLKEIAA